MRFCNCRHAGGTHPPRGARRAAAGGALVFFTAALLFMGSCTETPLRSVEGNAIVSKRQPAIAIEFDKSLTFAGSQEFVLRGHEKIEQYFFLEDLDGVIRRMYLVQFEGYLEGNTYIYNYSKLPTIRIAGRDFHNNAAFLRVPEEAPDDGSDQARAAAFLSGLGYRHPREELFQLLIWLWDEGARNELMIIYVEDLGEQGLSAADFDTGGKAAGRSDEMKKALLERALAGMKISE